jgi:hypothetical protein
MAQDDKLGSVLVQLVVGDRPRYDEFAATCITSINLDPIAWSGIYLSDNGLIGHL